MKRVCCGAAALLLLGACTHPAIENQTAAPVLTPASLPAQPSSPPQEAPRNGGAQNQLLGQAIDLFNKGRYELAISQLERGLRINRYSGDFYLWLGRCYQALNENDQALAFARQGLALGELLSPQTRFQLQKLGEEVARKGL